MKLPTAITITDQLAFADGGSLMLLAVDENGQECSILLGQTMFDAPNRGRLSFNKELVGVRSAEESEIIELIRNADFGSAGTEVDFARWCARERVLREVCDDFIARILAPLPPLATQVDRSKSS